MKDEDMYQLVVLEGILKEHGLNRSVCLFTLAEETVCVELLKDANLLVFEYEKGHKHGEKVCYNVYDAAMEVIDRVTDSYDLENEIIAKFNETIGKRTEKSL